MAQSSTSSNAPTTPRRERIGFCRLCINALKWLPVLLITVIVGWSYYAYVVQLCFCKYPLFYTTHNPNPPLSFIYRSRAINLRICPVLIFLPYILVHVLMGLHENCLLQYRGSTKSSKLSKNLG